MRQSVTVSSIKMWTDAGNSTILKAHPEVTFSRWDKNWNWVWQSLHIRLVITSRWLLFILGSKIKVTLNIKMVSAQYIVNYLSLSFLISRLAMTSRWPLFIFKSLGQRSLWPWMLNWFSLVILKTIYHKVFLFHK